MDFANKLRPTFCLCWYLGLLIFYFVIKISRYFISDYLERCIQISAEDLHVSINVTYIYIHWLYLKVGFFSEKTLFSVLKCQFQHIVCHSFSTGFDLIPLGMINNLIYRARNSSTGQITSCTPFSHIFKWSSSVCNELLGEYYSKKTNMAESI